MVLFEFYYDDLLKYSSNLLLTKRENRICAEDLVNEAYLMCFNKPEISKGEIKKIIVGIYYSELNKFISGVKNTLKIGEYKCVKCNEVKDVSCFRLRKKSNGFEYIETTCKSCEQNHIKTWNKKNRNKRRSIENKALKKRILNLTDTYLISLLKRQKVDITEIAISSKREEIIKIRNKKK